MTGAPQADGLSPCGSSQQAVSPVPASIPSAFTSGPWTVHERDPSIGQRVSATIGGTTFTICNAETPIQGGMARHDMREANAHLIAAAPDLFEALVALGEALGTVTVPKGHPLLAASEKANAALAKAQGEQ